VEYTELQTSSGEHLADSLAMALKAHFLLQHQKMSAARLAMSGAILAAIEQAWRQSDEETAAELLAALLMPSPH